MKKRLFGLLTCALTLVPHVALAQAPTPERLALVSQNCSVVQTVLDQLQRHDLVARTNRGRTYEAQNKQIEAFAQRMHNNNLSTQPLDTFAANFKATFERFRAAYVRYDDGMTNLRQIDCRNRPADFVTMLEQVRVLRREVGSEVTKGDADLARYRQALTELRATLPDAKEATQ